MWFSIDQLCLTVPDIYLKVKTMERMFSCHRPNNHFVFFAGINGNSNRFHRLHVLSNTILKTINRIIFFRKLQVVLVLLKRMAVFQNEIFTWLIKNINSINTIHQLRVPRPHFAKRETSIQLYAKPWEKQFSLNIQLQLSLSPLPRKQALTAYC